MGGWANGTTSRGKKGRQLRRPQSQPCSPEYIVSSKRKEEEAGYSGCFLCQLGGVESQWALLEDWEGQTAAEPAERPVQGHSAGVLPQLLAVRQSVFHTKKLSHRALPKLASVSFDIRFQSTLSPNPETFTGELLFPSVTDIQLWPVAVDPEEIWGCHYREGQTKPIPKHWCYAHYQGCPSCTHWPSAAQGDYECGPTQNRKFT